MIKIENFELLKPSGISYGGHGGSKREIIINDERWFLKKQKSHSRELIRELDFSLFKKRKNTNKCT